MYVDQDWRPLPEPPSRKPEISKRDERVILWFVAVIALLLLLAPIGGATIIQAVLASAERG